MKERQLGAQSSSADVIRAVKMHQDLIIHSDVRDWVFIPLTLLIIMMNMLRQYAHLVRRSHSHSTLLCSPRWALTVSVCSI